MLLGGVRPPPRDDAARVAKKVATFSSFPRSYEIFAGHQATSHPLLCRKAISFGFRCGVRRGFLGLVKAWPRNREVGAHWTSTTGAVNAIRCLVCTRAHRRRGHTRATRKGQGGRAHRGAAMATPMVGDDANAARARATPEPTTDNVGTRRDTKTNIRNRQRFETRVTDAVWSVRAHVLSRARVTSRGVTAFQHPPTKMRPPGEILAKSPGTRCQLKAGHSHGGSPRAAR